MLLLGELGGTEAGWVMLRAGEIAEDGSDAVCTLSTTSGDSDAAQQVATGSHRAAHGGAAIELGHAKSITAIASSVIVLILDRIFHGRNIK